MLRLFKGLLGKKVKEPQVEAPYKVEAPVVETVQAQAEPAPTKPKKAKAPAKPRAEKKPAEKKTTKPRAKKAAK